MPNVAIEIETFCAEAVKKHKLGTMLRISSLHFSTQIFSDPSSSVLTLSFKRIIEQTSTRSMLKKEYTKKGGEIILNI